MDFFLTKAQRHEGVCLKNRHCAENQELKILKYFKFFFSHLRTTPFPKTLSFVPLCLCVKKSPEKKGALYEP